MQQLQLLYECLVNTSYKGGISHFYLSCSVHQMHPGFLFDSTSSFPSCSVFPNGKAVLKQLFKPIALQEVCLRDIILLYRPAMAKDGEEPKDVPLWKRGGQVEGMDRVRGVCGWGRVSFWLGGGHVQDPSPPQIPITRVRFPHPPPRAPYLLNRRC